MPSLLLDQNNTTFMLKAWKVLAHLPIQKYSPWETVSEHNQSYNFRNVFFLANSFFSVKKRNQTTEKNCSFLVVK